MAGLNKLDYSDVVETIMNEINTAIIEHEEEYVRITVSQWLGTQEIHVSKQVIVRALQCFMTEHEEEYKELTKNDKESDM